MDLCSSGYLFMFLEIICLQISAHESNAMCIYFSCVFRGCEHNFWTCLSFLSTFRFIRKTFPINECFPFISAVSYLPIHIWVSNSNPFCFAVLHRVHCKSVLIVIKLYSSFQFVYTYFSGIDNCRMVNMKWFSHYLLTCMNELLWNFKFQFLVHVLLNCSSEHN